MSVIGTLDEAFAQLQRDPHHPVRATIGDLTIEVRVVAGPAAASSAADAFDAIGPWAGETAEEILALLDVARRRDPELQSRSR